MFDNRDKLCATMRQLQQTSDIKCLRMNLSKTTVMSNSDERPIILSDITTLDYGLGWMAFGKISNILKNKNIPLYLRIGVYNSCIVSVLTCVQT